MDLHPPQSRFLATPASQPAKFWSLRHRIFSTSSALAKPCSSSFSFRRWSSRYRRRSSRISVPGWVAAKFAVSGRDGFTVESRSGMDSPVFFPAKMLG